MPATARPPMGTRQPRRASRRRRYSANEVIFHEGDPADCLHIVTKGHVVIVVVPHHHAQLVFVEAGQGGKIDDLIETRPQKILLATLLSPRRSHRPLPDNPGRDRIARRRVGSICKKPER